MKFFTILVLALVGIVIADDAPSTSPGVMEDASLMVLELMSKYGYISEKHSVLTEDGYILEMHRIIGSPVSPVAQDKPAIFLMHGLLSSSADWVIMGPGKGLAYILADAGYDVWMGNARGNTYSKNHSTITDLTGKSFWYFSWHEIGFYDLPAMIDHILEKTGQEDLLSIAHSQGTTAFYVLCSTRTEYNAKIKALFSLAPVAYMGNMKSPFFRLLAAADSQLAILLNVLGIYEFLPSSELLGAVGESFCHEDASTQFLCTSALFVIAGFNNDQLNDTMLPVILGHSPAGASTRQLLHYGQGVNSNLFRQYDYGRVMNQIIYRSRNPPNYDMSLVTAPVTLVYSDNDWLADPTDVFQLESELSNVVDTIRVDDDKWSHLDFLWGIDAKDLVYKPVMDLIVSKYSN